MIIDSSALVAIMFAESDAANYARAIRAARERRISAVNYVETAVMIDARHDPVVSRRFDDWIREAGITIEPLDENQARVACEAYRDYGRGSGHPARLNFGDCFAYALARHRGEPLLFKGDDFIHTDIEPAKT